MLKPHPDQYPLALEGKAGFDPVIEAEISRRAEAAALGWRFRLTVVESILMAGLVLLAGLALELPVRLVARNAAIVASACFASGLLLIGLSGLVARLRSRPRRKATAAPLDMGPRGSKMPFTYEGQRPNESLQQFVARFASDTIIFVEALYEAHDTQQAFAVRMEGAIRQIRIALVAQALMVTAAIAAWQMVAGRPLAEVATLAMLTLPTLLIGTWTLLRVAPAADKLCGKLRDRRRHDR